MFAKGLVIADPWIGYILDGIKTWEMRSSSTSLRGPFTLIRKGTGAVSGIASLVEVGRALSPEEMLESFERHQIPAEMIRSGQVSKWNTPWCLEDVRKLTTPVPYEHPNAAVTWVNLPAKVADAIADQLAVPRSVAAPSAQLAVTKSAAEKNGAESQTAHPGTSPGTLVAQSQLTEGNIKNNHFCLRGYIHRFPANIVGGPNKESKAPREATIDWGGAQPALTDIDGQKQIFRGRGWIKQFFEANEACPGDWILVEETAPVAYKISLKKA